jgi:succinate dehydrogenase (ubiquinone) cytochrome b560 subunit
MHEQQTPQVVEQSARRPLSPHLTIYALQLTSLMSIGHRMTGAGLATLMYAFGLYYGISAPGTITESLTATVANAPDALVTGSKFVLATPFFYHTFNGIRHLVWDMGYSLSLRGTYIGGWLVQGASLLAGALISIF